MDRGKESAESYARMVVSDLSAGEIGDGSYTYDKEWQTVESYMVAGGGPTAWVRFVLNTLEYIDHAYVEFSDSSGTQLAIIPPHKSDDLLKALRIDHQAAQRGGR